MIRARHHFRDVASFLFGLLVAISLVLLLPTSEATTVIPVTGSFTLADQTVNDVFYNVSSMSSSSNSSLNFVTECTIEGGGIGFSAFTSSVSTSTIPLFNLTMAKTTVTNATIFITGYFPPHSTLMVSYTTATMEGATPLYDFRNLVLENHVVVYMLSTTATWNEDGPGGDVLLLGGSSQGPFSRFSGFYMEHTDATNAAHVVHQALPSCPEKYCLDMHTSLSAVDYATCTNCKGAFLQGDQEYYIYSASEGGLVRFSNCTSTGGQPFINTTAERIFSFGKYGNMIVSGINVDGPFSGAPSAVIYFGSGASYSFMHINVTEMGTTSAVPSVRFNPNVFAGNITLGGVYMDSITALATNMVYTAYYLDNYSKILAVSDSTIYTESVGSPSSVFCNRPNYTGSSWEELDGWERAQCKCYEGTYAPYCMPVNDPILYYVGYNANNTVVACNVANCTTCLTTTSDQCTECAAGYKLNEKLCVAKGCSAANCSSCVFDSEQNCSVCEPGYKLDSDNITCTPKVCQVANCNTCVTDSEDQCSVCDGNFKRGSNNISCVAMACLVENCDTCITEENTTCQNCSINYNLESDGTCTEMVCQVANCNTCAYGTEDQCSVCEGNFKQGSDNISCVAMPCLVENCDTCVTEENTTCQNCSANYKLDSDGTSCTEMVCEAANCAKCVYNSETLCDTCDGNFKRDTDNTTCVAMACNAENCDACVTEESTVCQNCSAKYKLESDGSCTEIVCQVANCSTCVDGTEDQCSVCEGNFRRGSDNISCVAMPCVVENCSVCVTEENTTCQNCSTNYKLDTDGASCTAMVCQVENCSACADNTEEECETCAQGYTKHDGGCANTASNGSGLSANAIVGIVIGIIVFLLLVALVVILLLCCCGKKPKELHAYENMQQQHEATATTTVEMKQVEEGHVNDEPITCDNDEVRGNPLLPENQPNNNEDTKEQQPTAKTRSEKRTSRRSRSIHRGNTQFDDVNVEAMYNEDNEILESP